MEGGPGAGGAGEQGGITNLLGLDYLATLLLWDSDALAPVAFAMKNKSDSLEFSFHKVRHSESKRSFEKYANRTLTCFNWDCL